MKIAIFGGGTVFHVRPHLALAAPAYGRTAKEIQRICWNQKKWLNKRDDVELYLTKMAHASSAMETNEHVEKVVDHMLLDPEVKVVFFSVAMCDFTGSIYEPSEFGEPGDFSTTKSGKTEQRLRSKLEYTMELIPSEKVIHKIRKERKDIFLVGFKTTTGASKDEMFEAGLALLKRASCNLVLVNDLHTRLNMIVTPEQSKYAVSDNRDKTLTELVTMTAARSQLTFTRSKVVEGDLIQWNDERFIPNSLRTVVDHCVAEGAYKPFLGKTVGHFAVKQSKKDIITSIRKTNFNELDKTGMVWIESSDKNNVVAHGAKPSVGGMSQRIIFNKFPNLDCIVHFHCQQKPGSTVPVRSQKEFECGSHECGQNTADGLKEFENGIYAVMLDKHGPNIVFNKKTDPNQVIQFIEKNFDLKHQTSELD